jgi:hypothetical protein
MNLFKTINYGINLVEKLMQTLYQSGNFKLLIYNDEGDRKSGGKFLGWKKKVKQKFG